MKFEMTEELKAKLRDCKTPEDMMKLAEENHIEISMEEIKAAAARKTKELSIDELDQVAGGGCTTESTNNYCFNDNWC